MERYQVIIAYDGTQYNGFQRQPQLPTVQQVVEDALHRLTWCGKSILAAGRTDSGVHAAGQVIAFDLDWRHSEVALRNAMNAELPSDISALKVKRINADFHPRYDAVARHYVYRLYCTEARNPLLERYGWGITPPLDADLMIMAAANLQGTHNFAGFGTPVHQDGTTVRTIFSAGWREERSDEEYPLWIFDVWGNAFLYHMVRRIVFLLVSIGQKRKSVNMIERLLVSPPKYPVQGLAPARGLCLADVYF
jgi:tRNA pseudouridine38-40 synthase